MTYEVCFRLCHPTSDPHAVTTALGITPHHVHRAGEVRPGPRCRTPWPSSVWLLEAMKNPVDANLETQLGGLLHVLEPQQGTIAELRKRGYTADFMVGCFGVTDQDMIILNPATMHRIVALGATIVFDIYVASSATGEGSR